LRDIANSSQHVSTGDCERKNYIKKEDLAGEYPAFLPADETKSHLVILGVRVIVAMLPKSRVRASEPACAPMYLTFSSAFLEWRPRCALICEPCRRYPKARGQRHDPVVSTRMLKKNRANPSSRETGPYADRTLANATRSNSACRFGAACASTSGELKLLVQIKPTISVITPNASQASRNNFKKCMNPPMKRSPQAKSAEDYRKLRLI